VLLRFAVALREPKSKSQAFREKNARSGVPFDVTKLTNEVMSRQFSGCGTPESVFEKNGASSRDSRLLNRYRVQSLSRVQIPSPRLKVFLL
jgi:hypothetical protein